MVHAEENLHWIKGEEKEDKTKTKRGEQEERRRLATQKREAEQDAHLEAILREEEIDQDEYKPAKSRLDIDFKDRMGRWVLRYTNPTRGFVQTRLGALHNNVTQRVRMQKGPYLGSTISDEFLDPQKFCDWVVGQPGWDKGYQLEKDLLGKGRKHYSAETCEFLPARINTAIIQPKGTTYARQTISGKWTLQFSIGRKDVVLYEVCATREEALALYKYYREGWVRKLANAYRGAITERAYEALMAWELTPDDMAMPLAA